MARYELYVCIDDVCDEEPFIYNDLFELLKMIHGFLRFNKKINKIIVKKR